MCKDEEPPADVWVYLDSSALIDIATALDGEWCPPSPMTPDAHRLLAAAQLTFYAHSNRNGWFLVSSAVARKEHLRGLALAWLDSQIHEIVRDKNDPTTAVVEALTARYLEAGLHKADAEHAAEAAGRPWIRYFVTNDARILKRGPHVALDHALDFITVEQAAELLGIQPGEQPPIAPHPTNPLADGERWWIPPSTGQERSA